MHDQFITPGFRRGFDVGLPDHFMEMLPDLTGAETKVLLCVFWTDPYAPIPITPSRVAEILRVSEDEAAEVLRYLELFGWIQGDDGDGYRVRWKKRPANANVYITGVDEEPEDLRPPGLEGARQEFMRIRRRITRVVFARDNYCCRVCGSQDNLTVDHIVPLYHNGSNDDDNFQTLCRSCNSRKGTSLASAS